jgi:hypothetical protein
MEVAAAGAGSPNPAEALVKALPELARVRMLSLPEDGIAHSLQSLASSQVGELLGRLEQARDAHDPQLFEGLLRTAVAAVGARNVREALSAITEMARLHPEHAAELAHGEAGLASIRGEMNQLFGRLTMEARTDAVQILAAATMVVPGGDMPAVNILEAGERLVESGTYINYVRASELGQMLINTYPQPPRARRSMELRWLSAMWRRVPLLVLLLGWFLIGLIGGIVSLAGRTVGGGSASAVPFEVWAGGFLALVGFQFVVTVWNIKFRP